MDGLSEMEVHEFKMVLVIICYNSNAYFLFFLTYFKRGLAIPRWSQKLNQMSLIKKPFKGILE
jgi:hypothetical protein